MVGNVHGRRISIELAVNGRRVRKERELWCHSTLVAGVVVEAAARSLNKEVADFEGLVGEVGGLPNSEAGRVSVPVVVRRGDVAHVVDLLAWVVVVNVSGLSVHGALEIVAAILYTP